MNLLRDYTEEGDLIFNTVIPFGETFEFALDEPGFYYLCAYNINTGSNALELTVLPNVSNSTADKLANLEQQNLILMDALATVYAETLGDKADDQTLTDLYTPLVEAGRKTVEQVPEKIRNAVQGKLVAKE